MRLRLGFLGDGHLAHAVRGRIEADRPYDVVGVVRRDDVIPDNLHLLVETATQKAAADRLPAVLARGTDVLLLSIGALADEATRDALTAGPGRLMASTGAIGGLDQVRALRVADGLRSAAIETRKLPLTLIQPWMDDDLRARLAAGREEIVLAEGPAAEVTRRFPASANVAAAVALAAGSWDVTTARVIADPAAVRTRHLIRAHGSLGSVAIAVENEPSPERPRSSAVVATAILRGIDDYARLHGYEAPAEIAFL